MTTTIARRRRTAPAAVALLVLLGTALAPGDAAEPSTVRGYDVIRMRASAPIVLTGPESVEAGSRLRLRGDVVTRSGRRVAGRRTLPRPVRLLERVGGRWTQVGRASSSRSGSFAFEVPAGDVAADRSFRAEASASRGRSKVRSRTVRVAVTATPAATGAGTDTGTWETLAAGSTVAPEPLPVGYLAEPPADDWAYLFEQGARWNPCAPVRWAYNPAQQAYDGAFADVVRAFARVSAVSGLQFQYVGATAAGYRGSDADITAAGPGVDMVVSWSTATQFPRLAGTVVGIGGGTGRSTVAADVRWRMVLGYLVLDAQAGMPIAPGFETSGWGQVMQHEILHALGLGHARTPTQLMFGSATSRNIRFGAGDLTGLARIGSASGCLT